MKKRQHQLSMVICVVNNSKDSPQQPAINSNIILYGPPGTGKTYLTRQKSVERILGSVNENKIISDNSSGEDILREHTYSNATRLIKKIHARLKNDKKNGNLVGRLHWEPWKKNSDGLWIKNLKNNIVYGILIEREGNAVIYLWSYSDKKAENNRNLKFLKAHFHEIEKLLELKFTGSSEDGDYYYEYKSNFRDIDEQAIEDIIVKLEKLDKWVATK